MYLFDLLYPGEIVPVGHAAGQGHLLKLAHKGHLILLQSCPLFLPTQDSFGASEVSDLGQIHAPLPFLQHLAIAIYSQSEQDVKSLFKRAPSPREPRLLNSTFPLKFILPSLTKLKVASISIEEILAILTTNPHLSDLRCSLADPIAEDPIREVFYQLQSFCTSSIAILTYLPNLERLVLGEVYHDEDERDTILSFFSPSSTLQNLVITLPNYDEEESSALLTAFLSESSLVGLESTLINTSTPFSVS